MTYDKLITNILPYQEGNKADHEFDMADNFPIEDVANISLQVRNALGKLMMSEKTIENGKITLTDRTVYIPFTAAEMRNISGVHNYEIDFINADGEPFATIGGTFTVNREINRR